jgi:hypothetical protein
LWGNTFGELRLRDNADNDVTAALAANSNIGGSLLLMDEDGTTNLSLFGGNTGDAAAILPQASINSLETSNEPGVSNRIELAQVILSGSPDTLVTRTITVPEEGYVLVMGSLNFNFVHTTGIQSYGNISLEDNFGGDYTVSARVGTGSASANWEMPTTIQGIFDVDAGANQYHLIVEEQSGALTASNAQLTLIYFPTAYGVVTSNKSEASVDIGLKGDAEISESQSFSEQRIAAELVTMRQQIEALKAQLDAQAQNE